MSNPSCSSWSSSLWSNIFADHFLPLVRYQQLSLAHVREEFHSSFEFRWDALLAPRRLDGTSVNEIPPFFSRSLPSPYAFPRFFNLLFFNPQHTYFRLVRDLCVHIITPLHMISLPSSFFSFMVQWLWFNMMVFFFLSFSFSLSLCISRLHVYYTFFLNGILVFTSSFVS